MRKKLLALSVSVLFLLSIFTFQGQGAVQAAEPASNFEMHIPLTSMTAYTSDYKTTDYIISGTKVDLSDYPGFTLLKDDSYLDLGASTFDSADFTVVSGTSYYDRTYSHSFVNTSYNAAVTGGTAPTETTPWAVSVRDTSAHGKATAGGGAGTIQWTSDIAYDFDGNGDFTDSSDLDHLPLPLDAWLYVTFKTDHTGTVNAGTYGALDLIFDRDTGTDYTVSIRAFQGSGDTGWASVGGGADNLAVFNAYDADNQWLAMSLPIGEIFIEDSSETGNINGLAGIRPRVNFAAASEVVDIYSTNIAIFEAQPAFTDRYDNGGNWDWNDAGGIAAGAMDTDSDFLQTKIVEGATESYDSTINLLKEVQNSITTLENGRLLTFAGIAVIKPTGTSSSSVVTSTNYYLTTESLTFDTLWIGDNDIIDTFANVFVWGDVKLNFTVDDNLLKFIDPYSDSIVSFKVTGQADKTDEFKALLDAAGVQGSDVPYSEVQYDIATPTGSVDTYELKYYSKTAENYVIDGGISSEELPPETSAGGGSPPTTEGTGGIFGFAIDLFNGMIAGDLNSWFTFIAIIVVVIISVWAVAKIASWLSGRR